MMREYKLPTIYCEKCGTQMTGTSKHKGFHLETGERVYGINLKCPKWWHNINSLFIYEKVGNGKWYYCYN